MAGEHRYRARRLLQPDLLMDPRQVRIGCRGISLQQLDRDLRLPVRVEQSFRIGHARGRGEVRAVHGVAAITWQREAVDRFHRRRARLGELTGDAREMHHFAAIRGAEHRSHAQQQIVSDADLVGVEFCEALRTVASLKDESLALCDVRQ